MRFIARWQRKICEPSSSQVHQIDLEIMDADIETLMAASNRSPGAPANSSARGCLLARPRPARRDPAPPRSPWCAGPAARSNAARSHAQRWPEALDGDAMIPAQTAPAN